MKNQILVIRVSEEITVGYWFELVVKECVLVRELDHGILQRANLLKHLICNLWIESDCAVLELLEGRIKRLLDGPKFFFESLELVFVLHLRFLQTCDLVV
jgi:hypothetical protein